MKPYRKVWTNRPLAVLAVAQTTAGLNFYVPISALFLTSRGLTYTQIFGLESILLIAILLFEVPGGVLSDRVDRRYVICGGFVLNAVAEMIFALGQDFMSFAISFALSGVGIAMLTGVSDAYVYESLGDTADDDATGVFGHMSALEIAAGVMAAAIGGGLAVIDVALPVIITAVAAGIAAVVSLFLPARPPEPVDDDVLPRAGVLSAVRTVFSSPVLLYVACAASAGFVLFNAVYTLNQPIFAGVGLPVAAWGIIVSAALLLAAVCNHFTYVLEGKVGRANALLAASGVGAVGFLIMAIPHALPVVIGFLLAIVGMSARGPVMGAIANRLIPSGQRATVLNVMSSLGSLLGVGINPAIGMAVDKSPSTATLMIGAVLLGLAIAWVPVARKHLEPST